ncbi:MAG: hypothetical protein RIB86_14690 [Imperialibacter sp.]
MKPENLEILLEQICQGIDDLKATPKQSASSGLTEKDLDRIDGVEQSQALIIHNLINLTDGHKVLTETVGNWAPVNKTEHHHEHVFFPGIIAWLDAVKRWKVVVAMALLLIISAVLNTIWYQQMEIYKVGFFKYYAVKEIGEKMEVIEDFYKRSPEKFISITDSVYRARLEKERVKKQIEELKKREAEMEGK